MSSPATATRKRISPETEKAILIKSARRCPICFSDNGDLTEKEGQIAHLDKNPANNKEDNLCFLCLPHHSLYDSKTSQHKNYTLGEVKELRKKLYVAIAEELHHNTSTGCGGKGGNAKAKGDNSGAIGGRGGAGGIGKGGDGGLAEVEGDNSFAIGGDGGNAGQLDGRGGPGAVSPMERMNGSTELWKYGSGGAGANAPEYDRRLNILTQIRQEYKDMFLDRVFFIQAGIDIVPINWVNKRLEEMQEEWRVLGLKEEGGYMIMAIAFVICSALVI